MALKRFGVTLACLLVAPAASAQDAGPDAGLDAGIDGGDDAGFDGGFDAGDPDVCATDEECIPTGRLCFDGLCGVCGNGDTRDCDEGCGPGIQSCNYPIRAWGFCDPSGAIECDPRATPPERLDCDHPCGPWSGGPGYRPCDATSCAWSDDCLNVEPIQCLPGNSAACVTPPPQLCPGFRTCTDDCSFGDCEPDPTVCECGGGNVCCGNGALDSGEECDGEKQCGTTCRWTEARPFRSCDCRTPGAAGSPAGAALLMAIAAVLSRRKRR